MVPILSHCTSASAASPPPSEKPSITELPTMPPTIEWVVDTGQPFFVANNSHSAAASSAAIMMKTNCIGCTCMAPR